MYIIIFYYLFKFLVGLKFFKIQSEEKRVRSREGGNKIHYFKHHLVKARMKDIPKMLTKLASHILLGHSGIVLIVILRFLCCWYDNPGEFLDFDLLCC